MGARGPIPVPTAKKDALGIASHHKRNTAEPRLKPETKIPKCPRDFDKDEKRHWREIWESLIAMRIGTTADFGIVRSCARNRGVMDKLWTAIRTFNERGSGLDGFVMVVGGTEVERIDEQTGKPTKKRIGGQMQPNTLYSLHGQAVDRDVKLSGLLGLEPANRTRLQMPLIDDKPKSRWGDTKPILTSKQA